jgi:hypothetical protein
MLRIRPKFMRETVKNNLWPGQTWRFSRVGIWAVDYVDTFRAGAVVTEEQILHNVAVMSAVSRSIAAGRSVSIAEVLSRSPV